MTTKQRASANGAGLSETQGPGLVEALDALGDEVGYLLNLSAAFVTARFELAEMSAEDPIGQQLRDGLCGLTEALERACNSLDMAERGMSKAVSATRQAPKAAAPVEVKVQGSLSDEERQALQDEATELADLLGAVKQLSRDLGDTPAASAICAMMPDLTERAWALSSGLDSVRPIRSAAA